MVFSIMAVFFVQARKHSTKNVVENCGANLLAIFYLGLLGGFVSGPGPAPFQSGFR